MNPRFLSLPFLMVAAMAPAQVLQSETFEAGFVTGDLDGQNGWLALPGDALPFVEPGMATVSTVQARSGARSVRLNAGLLFAGESLFAFKPLAIPVASSTSTLVVSEFWMRYGTPSPGASFGGASYDSTGGSLGGITIDSQTGTTYPTWLTGASGISTQAANSWIRVSAVHNMASNQMFGYINGQSVAGTSAAFTSPNFSDFDFFADGSGTNDAFFDDVLVERVSLGTIRGKVTLNDFGVSPAGMPVRIRVLDSVTSAALQTLNTTLNAAGEYTVTAAPRGSYRLEVKPWHWCSKSITSVNITDSGVFFLSTVHANGDPDQSDEVDAADIDLVIAAFGSTGSPTSLIEDIDGSGEVDAADIDVVIANFGSVGD